MRGRLYCWSLIFRSPGVLFSLRLFPFSVFPSPLQALSFRSGRGRSHLERRAGQAQKARRARQEERVSRRAPNGHRKKFRGPWRDVTGLAALGLAEARNRGIVDGPVRVLNVGAI